MTKVRYTGVTAQQLEECRAAVNRLREMRNKCKPLAEGYMALSHIIAAYQRAATYFTGKRYFFGGGGQGPRS